MSVSVPRTFPPPGKRVLLAAVFIALFVVNELLLQAEIRKMNALPCWAGTVLCQNLLEQEIRKTSVGEAHRCRAHSSACPETVFLSALPY